MRPPIDGATVLLTGASSGIGHELAQLFAPRAKHLVLVARRADRLQTLAEQLRARHAAEIHVEVCDLVDPGAIEVLVRRVLDRIGSVDVLVNNAGLGDMGAFDLSEWDKQRRLIELNVTAPSRLTHAFLPGMIERRRGGVLNISSGFGLQFMPGFATYVGTKHFVTGFSEALRTEVRPHGVVVTQVCPGPVATEFEQHIGNFTGRGPPSLVEIGADRCARAALRAFERDRALVVPGAMMKLVMGMGAMTPRFVLRWLYIPVGKKLRAMEQTARDRDPSRATGAGKGGHRQLSGDRGEMAASPGQEDVDDGGRRA